MQKRIKEHKDHTRLGRPEKSAIAQHIYDKGHTVDYSNSRVLAFETDLTTRKIKEAILIRDLNPTMNRDMGYELSTQWLPVLPKLRDNRPNSLTSSTVTQSVQSTEDAHVM